MDPPQTPATPGMAVLDGSAGGNPHFFFLNPLLPVPTFSGTFNPNLSPVVEVCTDTSQDALGHCTSLLDRFEKGIRRNGQTLEVAPAAEHYILGFRGSSYPIQNNVPFRIVVMIGDVQLGYIDLVKQGNSYRELTKNDMISRSGTVAIKFRIEEGALCPDSTQCFEGEVGPGGGTFTIDLPDGTKPAGTQFPSGALSETVNLIIEHVSSGECLPTDVPQYQGCYRFRTEPHVENFQMPVTVGVCLLDPAGQPFFDDQQLRLWKWSEVAGDPIEELERVIIDYLNCPPLTQVGSATTGSPLLLGAARAGSWLLKPLAALFGPSTAYAATDLGYEGGKLSNFSRIGWVRPLALEIVDGDGQTASAGSEVPLGLRARVVNKYGMTLMGVSGRVMEFTPSGDGKAAPPSAISDLQGIARTEWRMATVPGANTLLARTPTSRAIAPTPYQAEVIFNATGTQPLGN